MKKGDRVIISSEACADSLIETNVGTIDRTFKEMLTNNIVFTDLVDVRLSNGKFVTLGRHEVRKEPTRKFLIKHMVLTVDSDCVSIYVEMGDGVDPITICHWDEMDWLTSPKTVIPDMLSAIEMFSNNKGALIDKHNVLYVARNFR